MKTQQWLALVFSMAAALWMAPAASAQVYGTAPRGSLVPTFKPTNSDVIDILPAFVLYAPNGVRPVYYATYDSFNYNYNAIRPAYYRGHRPAIQWAHAGYGYSYPYDYAASVVPASYVAPAGNPVDNIIVPAEGYQGIYSASYPAPQVKQTTAELQIFVIDGDAEMWVNGVKSDKVGQTRDIIAKDMKPGKKYTYEIRAKWTQNGKDYDRKHTMTVEAGQQAGVVFAADDREVLPAPKKKL
jgi:uncharacterized protein (TIGR03000 family)